MCRSGSFVGARTHSRIIDQKGTGLSEVGVVVLELQSVLGFAKKVPGVLTLRMMNDCRSVGAVVVSGNFGDVENDRPHHRLGRIPGGSCAPSNSLAVVIRCLSRLRLKPFDNTLSRAKCHFGVRSLPCNLTPSEYAGLLQRQLTLFREASQEIQS